ncbi:DHA2 family efflux MFS transporter permease subunit [Actinoallomurus purpureus]|uniref:DHA2 family efflux MFS transporter permease subunit n=1 Tax=Actinoallomurus purpureus TaxID=478114 RepID=UPI00209320B3|nr:DHA2 family efflux MFS transporter permease subunit [Actinoallomurus purpureus]MCO6003373.1 DHA2 family efflux MFS transporter permease subunit [Actinoallomurus purpureus]
MATAPAPHPRTRPGTRPPHGGPRPMAIAVVIVLGSIMTVIDMTIVNVALGRLSQDFHAPVATIQWVATGYTLALATVIPATAWTVGRFGAKRAYLASIALFTLGSALAGLAWDTGSLIGFRALQGLGGGMITPLAMTIIIRAADPARMGRMMSVMGIPVLIGPLAGPILGGWLVDSASWRWIFFINIPIGALVLLLAGRIFPADTPQPGHRLDVPGLLMLSPGLAATIYGLATGGRHGDFGSAQVLVPTVVGAALVAGFVVRGLTARHPLIDLRLFSRRSFATAAGTLVFFTCAYFGSMLLLPLYYQVVRGQSATASGLLGIPQVLATGITMQITGRLSDRVSPGRLVPVGIALASSGFLVFTTQVHADTPYWHLIAPLVVTGVGVGMTIMPAMTAATRNVPSEQVPGASTALNITQQVSAALGTALISVLLAAAMRDRLPDAADRGTGAVRALATPARHAIAPRLADAFQHTYVWAVVLMVLALLPAFFLPRHHSKP